ncbi:hypothetical protein G9A89_018555 [Geosiphon pyriformis]|nr:hypothetical protein G9A89_018555 [Geosiphon pyriformis]
MTIRFRDLVSNVTFYHINTHFDDRGKLARVESAKLLLRKARDLSISDSHLTSFTTFPIILTGDYNDEEDSDAYKILTGKQRISKKNSSPSDEGFLPHFADTRYKICCRPGATSFGESYTFTGFSPTTQPKRIDYILINEDVLMPISSHEKESNKPNNKSDKNSTVAKVLFHGIASNRYDDNIYISDHRPVFSDLSFKNGQI